MDRDKSDHQRPNSSEPERSSSFHLAELRFRNAITCTPEELIATTWEYSPDDEFHEEP